MVSNKDMSARSTRYLRIAGWSLVALVLGGHAAAMALGVEGVNWSAGDFVFAAVVFGIVGGLFEIAARASSNLAYRIGTLVAVACGFVQIWVNLAVGIIGNEDNPANWTYFAVVLIAAGGAIVAQGSARLLVRAMYVAAGAQALFSVLHAIDGTPTPIIDAFLCLLWIGAARLFARTDRQILAA
ncbi:hypothetical protein [Tsuneonella sp. HG222]